MTIDQAAGGEADSGGPPTDGPAVPFWLVSLSAVSWRVLVVLAFAAVVAAIAVAIGTVTASIVVAGTASVAVLPLIQALHRRGWGASKAAAVGTFVVFGTIVLVFAVAAFVLVRFGPDIVNAVHAGASDLHETGSSGGLPPGILDNIGGAIGGSTSWIAQNAASIAGSVASIFSVLLFGAFTTFYLLASDNGWWRWLVQGLGDENRQAIVVVAEQGAGQFGGYVRRTAILAGVKGAIAGLAMAIMGVPLAIPFAILAFAGGFVPYLGSAVAVGAILLAALASIGATGTLVLVILIVAANLVVERLIARPLDRQSSKVNPAIVLIALPVGAWVAGFFGMVLAVPVAVALLTMGTVLRVQLRTLSVGAMTSETLVPPWLDLLAGWSWRLLVAAALLAIVLIPIISVPLLLVPLIVASVLAAAMAPAVARLVRRGWERSLAAAVVTSVLTLIVVGLMALAMAVLITNAASIATNALAGAGDANSAIGGLGGIFSSITDAISGRVVETIVAISLGIAGFALVIGIGVFLTFIALRDGQHAWQSGTLGLAPWRRTILDGAAERSVSVLGGYVIATGVVSLFGAATQFVLMVILGAPLALPVFVLSFFLGYIPYIGGAIGTLLATLLTITTGNPVAIAIMVIFTIVFNIAQGNVIQPLVFGKAVNLHPAIILLAIPAGNAVAGIMGMFLVVPVLGIVATTWRPLLRVIGPPPAATSEEPARLDPTVP